MNVREALSTGPGIWRPGSCCVYPGTGRSQCKFCVNHGHVGSLLCFIHITFFEGCMRKGLKMLGLGEVACSKQDLLKLVTLESGKAPRSGCGISFLLPHIPGGTAVPEFSESEEDWSCFWFAVGLPSSSVLARPQLAPHAGAGPKQTGWG